MLSFLGGETTILEEAQAAACSPIHGRDNCAVLSTLRFAKARTPNKSSNCRLEVSDCPMLRVGEPLFEVGARRATR